LKKHEKAETKEHKIADKMNKVVHKHDEALTKEQKAARVSLKRMLPRCGSNSGVSHRMLKSMNDARFSWSKRPQPRSSRLNR
jgi:hypothetical protein